MRFLLEDNERDVGGVGHYQGLLPEVGFTCSGRLLGWVFGANWAGNTGEFTELQIWRQTSEVGVYTKVGNTAIVTSQNQSKLYYYTLSTPLTFQAGDALGYYQPSSHDSQLKLLYEEGRRGELQGTYYYSRLQSPPTELDTRMQTLYTKYQIFINVIAGIHPSVLAFGTLWCTSFWYTHDTIYVIVVRWRRVVYVACASGDGT